MILSYIAAYSEGWKAGTPIAEPHPPRLHPEGESQTEDCEMPPASVLLTSQIGTCGTEVLADRTMRVLLAMGLYTKELAGIELIEADSVMVVPFVSAETPETIARPTKMHNVVLMSAVGVCTNRRLRLLRAVKIQESYN